jgi:glutamate formiminotransferase / 5-formyltetrahydrofolate cyclo-ligase
VLECVINISEGRDAEVVGAVAAAAGNHLLDVHSDADHNRSVLTLAGPDVEERAFLVVRAACTEIDLSSHAGAHPRLGAADVVPFVPLGGSSFADALAARNRVAQRIAQELAVPCFLYGPERALPDVRRQAFTSLMPDAGPPAPHPTAGASCVGARDLLVAYNLWLDERSTLDDVRRIAGAIRQPGLRTLGLQVGDAVQVSCNLVDPLRLGPGVAYDLVASHAAIVRAELVGLIPAAVLAAVPVGRWDELDVAPDTTIEARLEKAGLDGGS